MPSYTGCGVSALSIKGKSCYIRGRPFLRTVFLKRTMFGWKLTHPPTCSNEHYPNEHYPSLYLYCTYLYTITWHMHNLLGIYMVICIYITHLQGKQTKTICAHPMAMSTFLISALGSNTGRYPVILYLFFFVLICDAWEISLIVAFCEKWTESTFCICWMS